MQKYGDVEKIDVLRGEEAQVLNDHMARTGKYKVSDFNKGEKEELQSALNSVKSEDSEDDSE